MVFKWFAAITGRGGGGVSERWQVLGNRSNRLRGRRGATKSGESAGKLCEGAETWMCRAETKVRPPGSHIRKEWSGTLRDHSSTGRLSW